MMNKKLYKNCKLGLLLAFLVILGSFFRYLRTFQELSLISNAPYIIEAFIFIFTMTILVRKLAIFNEIDSLALMVMILIFLSYVKLSFIHGGFDQKRFILEFGLPFGVYYLLRVEQCISNTLIDNFLKIFLLIAVNLSFVEWTTTNYFGGNVFNFEEFWDDTGIIDYHASAIQYPLLGNLIRPWGIMALPQSSGTVISACVVYFAQYYRERHTLFYVIFGVIGVFISGSRTALVTLASVVFLLNIIKEKNAGKVLLGMLYVAAVLVVLSKLIIIENFDSNNSIFLLSIQDFFQYLVLSDEYNFSFSLDQLTLGNLLLGQGVSSSMNNLVGVGDVSIANIVIQIGIIASFLLLLIFFLLIYVVLKYCKLHPNSRIMIFPAFGLLITLFVGSFHYDAITRFPASTLIAISAGYLSRLLPPMIYSRSALSSS